MKFAVVSDWPDVKNAEYEVIKRLQIAARAINHECIIINGQGHEIFFNKKGYSTTKTRISEVEELDFILNLHFASPKLFNGFVYATSWNPPQFYFDWGYDISSRNYATADDHLVYGSVPIRRHLENLISSSRKNLDEAIQLVPSVPATNFEPLSVDQTFKVFYSGVNWERLGNEKGRHHDLFSMLDKEGIMAFYGPERFLGQKPWAGFKSYRGEIPFDGVSSMDKINKCGVSLVLSSDIHRDSHAATNRLYESLEAGAIIIADNNQFVMDEFGDCVLLVDYSDNHSKVFEQIESHIDWINSHREEARDIALTAQARYRNKYGLERQLDNLTRCHSDRRKDVESRSSILNDVGKVTIIFPLTDYVDTQLTRHTLASIGRQTYGNIKVILVIQDEFLVETEQIVEGLNAEIIIHTLDTNRFSSVIAEEQIVPRGRLVEDCLLKFKPEFWITVGQGDYWFDNHLATLMYPIINEEKTVSHSGWIAENSGGDRHLVYDGSPLSPSTLLGLAHRGVPGSVLVKSSEEFNLGALWYLDDFLEAYLKVCAVVDGSIGYTQAATMVEVQNQMLVSPTLPDEIQVKTIKDANRYNEASMITSENVVPTAAVATVFDETAFTDTLKRVLWNRFSKYPRFQRLAQRIYNKV